MTASFDWKPLLSDQEVVLWEGRPSYLKIVSFAAVLTAFFTAGWLMALGELAQAPGGAECVTDDCPTADRKAGFVMYFAGPVSILLGAFVLLWSAFIRQVSAITIQRVLTLTYRPWSREPTIRQVPVKGARPMLNSAPFITLGLLVFHPDAKKPIMLWARSRAEFKRAMTVIEQLSSEQPPNARQPHDP